jgi:hypothetical protein
MNVRKKPEDHNGDRCLPFLGDIALLSSIMLGQHQFHGHLGLSTYL